MDLVISQYDRSYIEALNRYNKALQQRNTMLKAEEEPDAEVMSLWEEQMELRYPVNWSKYPQLDYRNEMDGLYDNEPLKQFRSENGELRTGRKYQKYVA